MAEYGVDAGKDLNRQELAELFKDLAELLNKKAVKRGKPYELLLVGGAVMLLAYDSRISTRDSDGDYSDDDNDFIRVCVNKVAKKHKLNPAWLNRKFKQSASFTPALYENCSLYWQLPGLNVFMVNPDMLLCMKLVAFRDKDFDDVLYLVRLLRHNGVLVNKDVVYQWLTKFYKDYGLRVMLSRRMIDYIEVM